MQNPPSAANALRIHIYYGDGRDAVSERDGFPDLDVWVDVCVGTTTIIS